MNIEKRKALIAENEAAWASLRQRVLEAGYTLDQSGAVVGGALTAGARERAADAVGRMVRDYLEMRMEEDYCEDNDWRAYLADAVLVAALGDDICDILNKLD